MTIIEVSNLNKVFKIPKKQKDLSWIKQKLKWFYREWTKKYAVRNISFNINEGEIVGYIGPNGAGKSTTIKMLTSILTPTSGNIKIMGFHPQNDRKKYTKHIGVVFGQRSSLDWDIPIKESYYLFRAMYDIENKEFDKRFKYLTKVLGVTEFLEVPYRKLSLGERMRAELVAAFLHKPKIVFLDEPTIGLDVVAKHKIRDFLQDINKKEKVTIILTTHDMGDIEELANRIILIDHGKKMYDGDLIHFKKLFADWKNIEIAYSINPQGFISSLKKKKIEFLNDEKSQVLKIKIKSSKNFKKILKDIVDNVELLDLKIEDPLLENVVKEVYELKNKKTLK